MTHQASIFLKKALESSRVILVASALFLLSGCDSMRPATPERLTSRAEEKAKAGDYAAAVVLYEKALDGTSATADVHFRLGLIYDDKMRDPVGAIHHFRRYLALEPKGTHADEVRGYIEKAELGLITVLSRGVVLSEADAVKLRNENLALRKQIAQLRTQQSKAKPGTTPVSNPPKPVGPDARYYIVQPGDTLAAISRKFYKTSAKWKDILDANTATLQDAAKLKVGQRLVIP